jgi:hypothetical protein
VIFSLGRRYGELACSTAAEIEGNPNMPVSGSTEFLTKDLRVNSFMSMPPMYNAAPLAARRTPFSLRSTPWRVRRASHRLFNVILSGYNSNRFNWLTGHADLTAP